MSTDQKVKWAILVTGWGRNARDLIKAYSKQKLKTTDIALVIYEQEPCGAAELASQVGIETLQLFKKDFENANSYQRALVAEIQKRNISHIFMLNFKYIIREDMLQAFPNRIVNVHPSLFPSFLGTKTAIQDALDYGVKVTGITTHIIDDKIDEGDIICQTPIKVCDDDTFDSLYPKFVKKGKKIIIKTIRIIEDLYFTERENNGK